MLVSELPVSVQVRQGTSKPAFPNPSPPVQSISTLFEEASASEEWRVVVLYSPRVSSGSWRRTLTPRHAHVEHPNKTAPFHMMPIVGGQAMPWSRMLRASQVGNTFLTHANRRRTTHGRAAKGARRTTPGANSTHARPHRELQRMSDNPRTQIQPAMAAPHMPMQARLAAWPRRDLERSGMPICRQTTYAMPAQRVALGQTTPS